MSKMDGALRLAGQLSAQIWMPGSALPFFGLWACNKVQYSGADAMAKLMSGDIGFKPSAMYLEFYNGDIGQWQEPDVDFDGAAAYYASLGSSPNGDYLRVPLAVPASTSSGGVNYGANLLSFLAMTAGNEGVHGKPFGIGSYVVGGSIVAVPDWDDSSKDLIVTRGYLPGPLEKPMAPGEVVVRWKLAIVVDEQEGA
ncbi:MAG: hypothetical protein WC083_07850 [Candidatus Methanomethylophilaceae archaeon]